MGYSCIFGGFRHARWKKAALHQKRAARVTIAAVSTDHLVHGSVLCAQGSNQPAFLLFSGCVFLFLQSVERAATQLNGGVELIKTVREVRSLFEPLFYLPL